MTNEFYLPIVVVVFELRGTSNRNWFLVVVVVVVGGGGGVLRIARVVDRSHEGRCGWLHLCRTTFGSSTDYCFG